ncbi:hypothetical protein BD626DRAFT_119329 [Schizophyllum amplum]|uniref:F-box domain-containing protein n=1 Tax=Schizophyllum amplum TaxID=97359 RepID=A0A550CV29_9AGAR|nr:hypothetical protein BD626DRAFT_119329 [Auriculariopsis ampla]
MHASQNARATALSTADILYTLCSDWIASRQDLYALSLTCRTLSEWAIPALWRTLPDLAYLFCSVTRADMRVPARIKHKELGLAKTDLVECNVPRLRTLASHVRHTVATTTFPTDIHLWLARLAVDDGPLLPNLQSLHWDMHARECLPSLFGDTPRLERLVIGPDAMFSLPPALNTVSLVVLHGIPSWHLQERALPLAKLESLSVYFHDITELPLLARMPALRTLHIRGQCGRSYVPPLADGWAHLEEIAVDCPGTLWWLLACGPLPSLRRVRVRTHVCLPRDFFARLWDGLAASSACAFAELDVSDPSEGCALVAVPDRWARGMTRLSLPASWQATAQTVLAATTCAYPNLSVVYDAPEQKHC